MARFWAYTWLTLLSGTVIGGELARRGTAPVVSLAVLIGFALALAFYRVTSNASVGR